MSKRLVSFRLERDVLLKLDVLASLNKTSKSVMVSRLIGQNYDLTDRLELQVTELVKSLIRRRV